MISETLHAELVAEVEAGASVRGIAAEIGFTQPGLRRFYLGEVEPSGRLLDALAARYGMRLTKRRRR